MMTCWWNTNLEIWCRKKHRTRWNQCFRKISKLNTCIWENISNEHNQTKQKKCSCILGIHETKHLVMCVRMFFIFNLKYFHRNTFMKRKELYTHMKYIKQTVNIFSCCCLFVSCFVFPWDSVSLCSPNYTGAHSVEPGWPRTRSSGCLWLHIKQLTPVPGTQRSLPALFGF